MKELQKKISCSTFWCTFSGFYTGVLQLHKINLKFFNGRLQIRKCVPETHQLEAWLSTCCFQCYLICTLSLSWASESSKSLLRQKVGFLCSPTVILHSQVSVSPKFQLSHNENFKIQEYLLSQQDQHIVLFKINILLF